MAIITEIVGDIFSALPKSILIHACNARGAWGSGVAFVFKQKYPNAFHKYSQHCHSPPCGSKISVKQHQANLVGTALLIPPSNTTGQRQACKTPHYIACLFTSLDYGKNVSPADVILENTRNALRDLAKQVAELKQSGEEVGNCHAVRINCGKFGVEWQQTKTVLEAGDLDITVIRPEQEETVNGADTAASGDRRQPPITRDDANGSKPPKAARAKAESSLDKHVAGLKRKLETDIHGDDDSDRENRTTKQIARLHPGIAKRRTRLRLNE